MWAQTGIPHLSPHHTLYLFSFKCPVVQQDNIPKSQKQHTCVLQTVGNIFTILHSEQIFHLTTSNSGDQQSTTSKQNTVLWWDERWGTLVIINTDYFNNLYGMFYEKYLIWSCNYVQKQTVCLLFVVTVDMYVEVINAIQVFRL